MNPMITTLAAIRAKEPCAEGYRKLLAHIGKTQADDEPLPLRTILDSNGLDDALWALRCVEGHEREVRLFAVWCARQVQHLMADPRSIAALDVAERYANGDATAEELDAVWAAARDAAWAAVDAADAAWAAADAVRAAADAARADTRIITAREWAATRAKAAMREKQQAKFIELCEGKFA